MLTKVILKGLGQKFSITRTIGLKPVLVSSNHVKLGLGQLAIISRHDLTYQGIRAYNLNIL